ncbi:uncharacterized protein LOC117174531 [Belonocnema kinseyi]|uniref:uncharacterized protein LOC117174531 n=1 Tax=Belonocnema kinseyi TaxID=2817044 RepID=UPI00143CCA88|nr:uncharacterized protein LOC117174531 [Belonocnema kinseyi]
MWFALRASYLVAVVLCNVEESRQDDTKRSFLARRAIDGSRGRKYYEAKDDGFFDDYGFEKGQYRFGASDIRSNVPGEPGIDYPAYERLPQTSFSCEGRDRGYYADVQAGCQMFHVCDEILVSSFLCPVGSLFSQKFLTCDWWNKVDCSTAKKFYAINRNLYHQDDGDEMIRKAYVMVHLEPDRGLTTEPEEREREGKIVHFTKVDTPENDLPNTYDDLSNNPDYHEFSPNFNDYSNQFKPKINSREEEDFHDHVLFSQEYQTNAPKMYSDSPIVRIHQITGDHHRDYEDRQKTNRKEQDSHRFRVNNFQHEFQPSYAPTVPTVTTTTRRFYSPTVPSFRSSTLSYNKLDQNFDSSIHLYAQGKNSQATTTPATIFRDDSRSQRNSTRGSQKYVEKKPEVMKVTVNYNGREDDYNDRETYDQDQLYYEEQDRFEIMEGRESIGLAQSPSERLGETTVETPLETTTGSRKPKNLNSTFQNYQGLQVANSGYKKDASNLKEVVRSSTFDSKESENNGQDAKYYPTFTEATIFEPEYSNQGSKDEYTLKTEEIPVSDDHYDLNSDVSATTLSYSYQNKDMIVEHQSNQGMIEKKINDEFRSTTSLQQNTDNFPIDHEDLKGHDDLLMSTTSHPYNTTSESIVHEGQSIFRLSAVLQPPFENFKPFHINVEELTEQNSTTESQPTRTPIPYQRYSDHKDSQVQPSSTRNTFQIKKSPSDDENPSTTARSNNRNSSNHSRHSRLESSELNLPEAEIIPPLENQGEEHDPVQLSNNINYQINNISVPSIHQEPPKFNNTNDEAEILSRYNPNLDFTIRTAIWNQPKISENKDPLNSSEPAVDNPFLNHRTISLELEPPSQNPPEKFEDEVIFPAFQSITPESELTPPLNTQNQESSSENAEIATKSEEKLNLYQTNSTLKPDFSSSIAEIDDTIEESNAPYQVTLTLNENQGPETVGMDLIGKLVNQHEKGNFQEFINFEDFEVAKSEESSLPLAHEDASTVDAKTDFSANPFLKNHFGPSTESVNYELSSKTHNRTGKNAEIRNLETDVHRMSLLQLMSELAKANRLPRPFSQKESETSTSSKSESSNEPSPPRSKTFTRFFENPFLSSTSGSSLPSSTSSPTSNPSNQEKRNKITLSANSVSSAENPFLRKEVILEQLEKHFGQPLYGSMNQPVSEFPKQNQEKLFELPSEERITDFKTGEVLLKKKSKELVGVPGEASTTLKPEVEKETEKTVVEMEFVPSLGFSFDTHEGREEYAKAVLEGLVTEEAVLKAEDEFATSTQNFENDETTKNLKSNKNDECIECDDEI